jgi:hypothetical protein
MAFTNQPWLGVPIERRGLKRVSLSGGDGDLQSKSGGQIYFTNLAFLIKLKKISGLKK